MPQCASSGDSPRRMCGIDNVYICMREREQLECEFKENEAIMASYLARFEFEAGV